MNADEFDRLLQQQLDARRDPLDCAALCTFLAAHPERLQQFAALRESLRLLPAMAAPRRRRQVPLRLAAAAACAAVLVCGYCLWPEHAIAPGSTILASSLQEIRPRAHVAVQFSMRQELLTTPTTKFETYDRRSQRR